MGTVVGGTPAPGDVQVLTGCGPSQHHPVGLAVLGGSGAGLGTSTSPLSLSHSVIFWWCTGMLVQQTLVPEGLTVLREGTDGAAKKGQTMKEVWKKGAEMM